MTTNKKRGPDSNRTIKTIYKQNSTPINSTKEKHTQPKPKKSLLPTNLVALPLTVVFHWHSTLVFAEIFSFSFARRRNKRERCARRALRMRCLRCFSRNCNYEKKKTKWEVEMKKDNMRNKWNARKKKRPKYARLGMKKASKRMNQKQKTETQKNKNSTMQQKSAHSLSLFSLSLSVHRPQLPTRFQSAVTTVTWAKAKETKEKLHYFH